MIFNNTKINRFFEDAQEYADKESGCKKVAVGSALVINSAYEIVVYGANKTLPICCKEQGCRRIDLYGEDSKNHRLPSDCRAIHSEIDAIAQAAAFGMSTRGATMFITRYPCEACARAIVRAGIKKVYYGREQEISEETKRIFEASNVIVKWVKEWTYEDVVEK
mgnify:FL=1